MILCVDIGNTATKIAVVAGARVVHRAVVSALASERELARACVRVLRGARSLDAAAVSSVRPRATDAVVRMIVRATGLYPIVVNHRTPMPIDVAVRYPARVGADRLCAACGAVGARRRDAIVVDGGFGDHGESGRRPRVRGGRDHAGSRGIARRHARLHRSTSRSSASTHRPPSGSTTPSPPCDGEACCRRPGASKLAVEMLDRRAGSRPTRFVTGGDAPRIARWLPRAWSHVPDLTLLGLARIAGITR